MKKLLTLLVIVSLFSCEKEDIFEPTPLPTQETVAQSDDVSDSVDIYGDPSKGLDLYLGRNTNGLDMNGRACVNCHLSPTGVDIAQFGKINIKSQDSIVMHRAMGHISKEDSYHIAAYIKSLNVTPNDNSSLSTMIGIDNSNGVEPHQIWDGSSSLTVEGINSWDFRNGVTYDFEFPRWFKGDENNDLPEDNLDWLPEIDLLTEKGGNVSITYETYLAQPTKENLKEVLIASHHILSEGERNPGEHGFNDFEKSFEYQRWIATLYMQHVLKPNSDLEFGEELTGYDISTFSMADGIWDVGNIARRSQDNGSNVGNGQEIDNRLLNEVQWLYMGWLTNYGKRNSFETQYIGTALKDFGDQDLASLVILKSIISRSDNSQRMYDDVFTMGYITSDDMFYESVVFGLDYLIDGVNSGDNHFILTDSNTINISMGYLKNDSNDPDLKQFVESKSFLSQNEKDIIIGKINTLYDLLDNM